MNNRELQIGRRRYKTRLVPKSGWPELTALVDILFLVLLFFFLSTSFVRVSGIRVNLPRVRPPSMADLEKFVVTVTQSDTGARLLYFNDKPVTLEALQQQFNKVRGRSRESAIIILVDRNVSIEQSAEVMALAEAEGLASFLVTTPSGTRTETVFGQ